MDVATIRAMQSLSHDVWRDQPEWMNPGCTVGELAWEWGLGKGTVAERWRTRLWADGNKTLAWGWVFPPMQTILSDSEWRQAPAALTWLVHPSHPELLDGILDWFEEQVPAGPRATVAMQANADACQRIERHGFRHDPDAPWGMLNIRDLDDIEEPLLPTDYRGLTMGDLGDISSRVDVHRAAWTGSSLTEEAFRDVMSVWPYRDDLDFIIQADDGTLVASAIGWYDEEHRVGEFEPVGTHPDYRGRLLGRALLLFGMHRLRATGATHAIVGCRGDDNYPIPKKLYRSVGFQELTRELRFIRSMDRSP